MAGISSHVNRIVLNQVQMDSTSLINDDVDICDGNDILAYIHTKVGKQRRVDMQNIQLRTGRKRLPW